MARRNPCASASGAADAQSTRLASRGAGTTWPGGATAMSSTSVIRGLIRMYESHPSRKEPTEEAQAIGRYLAEFPPGGYGDRYSAHGWARIADAVWAAEDVLKEPPVDLDGRSVPPTRSELFTDG